MQNVRSMFIADMFVANREIWRDVIQPVAFFPGGQSENNENLCARK